MCALYAFSRHTDDLGDSDEPLDVRVAQLQAWRQSLTAAFAGGELDPLLPAVADTVQRFSIPPEHLYAVIEGVERDLRPEGFETPTELLDYCHKVASAVGIACLHIWSERPQAAYAAARDCGVAFQLTNILRDLKEDAARGRVYLPEDELRDFGVSRAQMLTGQVSDELVRLLQFQVDRADGYYARGWETRRFLTAGPRRAFDLMFRTYHELLTQIRHQPLLVLRRRLRLHPGRKIWIAATTCLGRAPPRPIAHGRSPTSAADVPSPTPP